MVTNMNDLDSLLMQVLEKRLLTTVFQPIVSLHHKNIIGYEALTRGPENSLLHQPMALFEAAEDLGLTTRLEFACREAALNNYAQLKLPHKLFLNVSPNVLLEPDFKQGQTLHYLKRLGMGPNQVVIELTEHHRIMDFQLIQEAVTHYRSMGFEIALDDLGAGYSGLRLWAELLPEYVKIDKHFTRGLHRDPIKLNFVRSIQNMAHSMNCHVIAEGIEQREDYNAINTLNISYAQGYYFAKPLQTPKAEIEADLFNHSAVQPQPLAGIHSQTIAIISRPKIALDIGTKVANVMRYFQEHPNIEVIPIVNNNQPIGIISKNHFFSRLFSTQFGLDLYGNKPVTIFMEQNPLFVEYSMSIEEVSHLLTSNNYFDKAFVITQLGMYFGIGTIIDLLQAMTQQQIKNAQHANPLTLLPGSSAINEWLNTLLRSHQRFAVAYFDLDNFKPYNDLYGYSQGDEIIQLVAKTLKQYLADTHAQIGHIGGDDFIVIFRQENWLECCQTILQEFALQVPHYYNQQHREAGCITSYNRQGEQCIFPLLSLSIGIVAPEAIQFCHSHVDISDLASEAKHHAKLQEGNSYFVNRRNQGNIVNIAHPEFLHSQTEHRC